MWIGVNTRVSKQSLRLCLGGMIPNEIEGAKFLLLFDFKKQGDFSQSNPLQYP
jgi:hypothetical protein